MKVVSTDTEIKTIISLCNGEEDVQNYLLARLKREDFGYDPCIQIFDRIKYYLKKDQDIPKARLFAEDIGLDEDAKEILKSKLKPISKTSCKAILETLVKYKKLRIVSNSLKEAADELKQKKIKNVDNIVENLLDGLAKIKTNGGVKFTNQKNNKKIIDKILNGKISLVETGYNCFDSINGGLPNGGVTILAASSGGGKSTFALNLTMNQYKMGYNPAIISLEMDEEELWSRAISNETKIPFEKIYQKQLNPKQKKVVMRRMREFKKIGDKKGNSIHILSPKDDLRFSELIFAVKHKKIDILYIDYISLLKPESGAKAQWEQLGEITRLAKRAAEQMNIPIVLLAQVKKEELEIKYSGAINEHANLVIMWHYDEKAATTHEVEMTITKARNQKKFKFILGEKFETMSFVELDSSSSESKPLDELEEPAELKEDIKLSGLEEDEL